MAQRKKRILLHSNYCGAPTGNGDNIKNILTFLYKTGKYELANYANGVVEGSQDFQRFPWKVYGSLPNNQQQLDEINSNPGLAHKCGYGYFNLDKVILDFKPDIYISLEDFWQNTLCENINKKWWNKLNCIISWTADSKPLLKDSLELATKIKNHYVWAKFAEKEYKKEAKKLQKTLSVTIDQTAKSKLEEKITAYESVKTLRGMINTERFYSLPNHIKLDLRKKHNIDADTFIVGTGSRSQLRKRFDTVIEAFSIFQKENSKIKTKLLFYCDLREGWDIPRLIKQFDLKNEDILFTYKCRATNTYLMLPFQGQEIDNPTNGAKKSLVTVGMGDYLPVECINEYLNLLDCFTLPITSGGQEYWAYQAKLCELPTLLNNYSCFEDLFEEETGSLEIDQAFTREIGTDFIKAAPYPSSLARQLKKIYDMPPAKRKELGKIGRQWVLNNASIEVIGKQWEEIINVLPFTDYDFNLSGPKKDPNAVIPPQEDTDKWIRSLYSHILKGEPDDQGFAYWKSRVTQGMSRDEIEQQFRQIATQENAKNHTINLEEVIRGNPNKRALIVLPESIGDLYNATAVVDSIKKNYPEHDLYFSCYPQYAEIFKYNKNIHMCLPHQPLFESEIYCTGQNKEIPLFHVYINLSVTTQKFLNYLSNDKLPILQ